MQNGGQRPTIFSVLPFPSLAFISANVLSAWIRTQSLDHWSVGDGNRACAYILSLVACHSPTSLICPLPPTSPTPPECFCAVIPERAGKKSRLWSPIFPILSAISSMLCRKLFHWVNSSTPPPLHRMLSPSSDCFLFCWWCVLKNNISKLSYNQCYWSLISWLIHCFGYIHHACFWPKTLISNDCLPINS